MSKFWNAHERGVGLAVTAVWVLVVVAICLAVAQREMAAVGA